MANKNVKRFDHKVYVRKIIRNIVKRQTRTNKIGKIWHQLKLEGRV